MLKRLVPGWKGGKLNSQQKQIMAMMMSPKQLFRPPRQAPPAIPIPTLPTPYNDEQDMQRQLIDQGAFYENA